MSRLPGLDRHVLGGDVDPPAADVVDQDVDGPVLGESRAARALGLRGLPHVGLDREDLTTPRADLRRGLIEGGLLAPYQDDVRPRLGEAQRHLAPEPPAAAGDECTLAVESESVEDAHPEPLPSGEQGGRPHRWRRPPATWRSRYFGVTPMFVTRIVWSGRGRKLCTQPCTP